MNLHRGGRVQGKFFTPRSQRHGAFCGSPQLLRSALLSLQTGVTSTASRSRSGGRRSARCPGSEMGRKGAAGSSRTPCSFPVWPPRIYRRRRQSVLSGWGNGDSQEPPRSGWSWWPREDGSRSTCKTCNCRIGADSERGAVSNGASKPAETEPCSTLILL